MPSGYEDFGANPFPTATISDLREAISRLRDGFGAVTGSGRLMYSTGFESAIDLMGWSQLASGGVPQISLRQSLHGAASLSCLVNAGTNIGIYKNLTYGLYPGKWGFEIGILADYQTKNVITLEKPGPAIVNPCGGQFALLVTGVGVVEFGYYSTPSTYVKIADLPYFERFAWHWIKMILDFENNKYVSISFDGALYDLSAIPLYTLAPQVTSLYTMAIKSQPYAGRASITHTYWDDFLLTANEP